MRLTAYISLIACIFVASCATQSNDSEWVNRDLQAKGTARDQYIAIGRGDIAECQTVAARPASQLQAIPDCRNVPIYLSVDCSRDQERVRQDNEPINGQVFAGCMARRGWLWTRVR